MRYYKQVVDGRVVAIGTGSGGTEITPEEYILLQGDIRDKAALVARISAGQIGIDDVREDWREEIAARVDDQAQNRDIWSESDLLDKTNAELEQIMYGMGVSASMTKANMVTLILALQGDGVV